MIIDSAIHILPADAASYQPPERFTYPFAYTPHPWARLAAEEVMDKVHAYMGSHPESELHRQGKMFGVLVVAAPDGQTGYLAAFSAMLDGTYHHDGFVPPVVDISLSDGYFRQEERRISSLTERTEKRERSQALQRWLFAEYQMLNANGHSSNLLDIFRDEREILSESDYFSGEARRPAKGVPPAGAGECCAPKLLQQAYLLQFRPLCMAEFWIGASPRQQLRRDGVYYPACQGKCRPILRHMLSGLEVDENPLVRDSRLLADKIERVYEDDDILVVNKPSGLLSTVGRDGYSVEEWAAEQRMPAQTVFAPKPAHRLDQDTSGLLVVAKTEEAYRRLQQQFLRREVKKRYEAILEQQPTTKEGAISLPLLPDPFDRPRQMVNLQHGKPAVTHYRVRRTQEDGRCHIDLFPETGRTHQLRVHCAHPDGLNSPILGDRLYGTKQTAQSLMLCAAEITFHHPSTGDIMHFVLPAYSAE